MAKDLALVRISISVEHASKKYLTTSANLNVNMSELLSAIEIKEQIEQYIIDIIRHHESTGDWPKYEVETEEENEDEDNEG